MFALGCLKFIKHSLQNSRQLLDEMKLSRLFWVQMISCSSPVKVTGTQWQSEGFCDGGHSETIYLKLLTDSWLSSLCNREFDAKSVPSPSPRGLECGGRRAGVGFTPWVLHGALAAVDRDGQPQGRASPPSQGQVFSFPSSS